MLVSVSRPSFAMPVTRARTRSQYIQHITVYHCSARWDECASAGSHRGVSHANEEALLPMTRGGKRTTYQLITPSSSFAYPKLPSTSHLFLPCKRSHGPSISDTCRARRRPLSAYRQFEEIISVVSTGSVSVFLSMVPVPTYIAVREWWRAPSSKRSCSNDLLNLPVTRARCTIQGRSPLQRCHTNSDEQGITVFAGLLVLCHYYIYNLGPFDGCLEAININCRKK